ncbi:alpha-amylase family glycosyl hydrolase [Butyrivibrio sp. YAB3001]|uniref:alpha-amylase family glycosyl hydrolase n=1 Tax=Butyrivibrio sp. YAB3001 TaxID=1520812 RepID=UPI0008F63520|nr:alpha-amylase family glycosyl hydrolase [Butyrivibrio sp. YAB3001]SFC60942.1 Glycosidase [Butyrivibrio sp. YAB3001]
MKRKIVAILLCMAMLGGCGVSQNNAETSKNNNSDNVSSDAPGAADDETKDDNDSDDKKSPDSENAEENNIEDTSMTTQFDSIQNLPLNVIDDKYRTTYEIFVYSFYDSDGDGIGDLKGVSEKLDYINDGDDSTDTDLGCNQIWLMPISPSPTYHKYDITDYKEIDPEYGTMADFEELLDKCHKRDVNLIIDLVLNHTSSEHQWFKDATRYLKDHPELTAIYADDGQPISEIQEECPYLYYYNFTREKQTGFVQVNGTEWYYEARFWSGMPDLNLDNPAVRDEISDITKFWIDKGVDGFRLDAVTSYYTNNDAKNIEFMTWLNDTVKAQKEDAYLVGEAWTSMSTYSTYYESGIDSFFDFDFSGSEGAIASVARGKKAPLVFAKALSDEEKELEQHNSDYINAPFYTNHDMARSAGYYVGKGAQDKIKLAGALNLLMGGNAFVYYGEELGMKGSGKDENKRAPMQWVTDGAADKTGMCDGPKDMESFKMAYPGLDEQAEDEYSIYNYYKKTIRLRNTYPVIARGKTQPVESLSEDKVGAFVRYLKQDEAEFSFEENGDVIGNDGNASVLGTIESSEYGAKALLLIINNSDEEKTVDLSKWNGTGDEPMLSYELCTGEEHAELDGMNLKVPAYGIAVLR